MVRQQHCTTYIKLYDPIGTAAKRWCKKDKNIEEINNRRI